MKTKLFVLIGITALLLLTFTAVALASINSSQTEGDPTGTLVQTVRQATERFKDVDAGGSRRLRAVPRLRQRPPGGRNGHPLRQRRPGR